MTYIFLQILLELQREKGFQMSQCLVLVLRNVRDVRESLAETISAVGRTIVTALPPREGNSKDAEDPVEHAGIQGSVNHNYH